MKNYLEIKHKIPFRSSFMYIDVEDYLADEIFINHELTGVYFSKKELYNGDSEFVFSRCYIFTKDKDKFYECMEHLRRKIDFLGYDIVKYDELSEVLTMAGDYV